MNPYLYCFLRRLVACCGLCLGAWPAWAQAPTLGPATAIGASPNTTLSVVKCTAIDGRGYVYVAGFFSGTVQFGSTTLTSGGLNASISQGFVAKLDGAGEYQWVRPIGGPSYTYTFGLAVAANGNVTVSGMFSGSTATVGPFTLVNAAAPVQGGTFNGFVARLDTDGNWQWATAASGAEDNFMSSLALDAAGNVYVSGGFQGKSVSVGATTLLNANSLGTNYDLLVAKLTTQGAWQWARSGGGPSNDVIRALALDASGNIYCAGVVEGTATFGSTTTTSQLANADILVTKLDANGNWLWATRGSSTDLDEGEGIAVDAAGNAYVAGHFRGPVITFGAISLANANASDQDATVAKVDAAGTWQWAVRAGGSDSDAAGPIAFAANGQLVVAGTFASGTAQFGASSLTNTATGVYKANSLFLASLSPATGAWLGATGSQGGIQQMASSLAADAYGNVSLGGSFQGASLGLGTATLAGQAGLNNGFVTLVPMKPQVDTFAPSSGVPGTVVAVTGSGFAGVVQVLFNGVPAPAFTVQSTKRLLATVPMGATAGPVSVLTSISTGSSGTPFQPVVLAAAVAAASESLVWPNPVGAAQPWQVRLPAALSAATRAEVRNVLGQLVFQGQFAGQAASLPVPRLVPGVYQLTLWPAGQPALQRRVVVAD